jgi:hypothetical protein
MKINPNLTLIQGQRTTPVRRAPRTETVSGTEWNTAAFEVVSLENRRASQINPPSDLGAAEEVLRRVEADLAGMTKKDLRTLHRLDGLVHVYRG